MAFAILLSMTTQTQNKKENKMNLTEKDYLEIIDMTENELLKFTKKELIDLIHTQAACLLYAEKELHAKNEED